MGQTLSGRYIDGTDSVVPFLDTRHIKARVIWLQTRSLTAIELA